MGSWSKSGQTVTYTGTASSSSGTIYYTFKMQETSVDYTNNNSTVYYEFKVNCAGSSLKAGNSNYLSLRLNNTEVWRYLYTSSSSTRMKTQFSSSSTPALLVEINSSSTTTGNTSSGYITINHNSDGGGIVFCSLRYWRAAGTDPNFYGANECRCRSDIEDSNSYLRLTAIPQGVSIYTSSGWQKATPYVYSGGWQKAGAYVYSGGWKTRCASSTALLPSEYQQVEYITFTGTQHINAETTFLSGDVAEFDETKFYCTSISGDRCVLGTRASGAGSGTGIKHVNVCDGNVEIQGNWGYNNAVTTVSANTWYTIKCNEFNVASSGSQLYYLNSTNILSKTSTNSLVCSYPIFIGKVNEAGSGTWPFLGHIKWSFINNVYGSSTTHRCRYLVPCYRKSDSVIGFYDVMNSVFLVNSGTGTFGKGSDVN